MWQNIMGRLPANAIIICALLSALIPYSIYKLNQVLHKHGDPPWKKEEQITKNDD
jgi:hypothetical protein